MEIPQNKIQYHIDYDGAHKDPLAEHIDCKGGSPVMYTIALGKAKFGQRHLDMPTGGKCETDKLGERPKSDMHNLKHWKYNKIKGQM
eukprot:13882368-Heterocapsa_arctica.AAC.1